MHQNPEVQYHAHLICISGSFSNCFGYFTASAFRFVIFIKQWGPQTTLLLYICTILISFTWASLSFQFQKKAVLHQVEDLVPLCSPIAWSRPLKLSDRTVFFPLETTNCLFPNIVEYPFSCIVLTDKKEYSNWYTCHTLWNLHSEPILTLNYTSPPRHTLGFPLLCMLTLVPEAGLYVSKSDLPSVKWHENPESTI